MENEMMERSEILLYSDENGKEFVSVVFKDETFWLTQKAMAELFGCTPDNISLHLKNIFAESELILGNCRRRKKLSDPALQPRCHHRRRLPCEFQKGHPIPPVGDEDAEGVHPEGLCAQR